MTAGPPTVGANVGACPSGGDIVAFTSPGGANPPEICGQLTGQHSKSLIAAYGNLFGLFMMI